MTERTPRVTAVIVTYQSRETISEALDALHESHAAGLADAVVVDNASKDGTADLVAEQYPWVTLIRSDENLGFGRGCNRGVECSSTPYILFLNPDALLSIDALRHMIEFMGSRSQVGICGPAVVEASGAIQPAGGLPSPWRVMLKPIFSKWASRDQWHVQPGEEPRATDRICGSIMLVRRTMIDTIGAFDPRFFLYFEETDLCCRARQAGWEIWTTGKSVGRHVNAASAKSTNEPMMWGTISEHYFRSRLYYLKKHYGWPLAAAAEIGEISAMMFRAVIDRLIGRSYANLGLRLQAPIMQLPSPVEVETKVAYLCPEQ